jgi:hypothetical protein
VCYRVISRCTQTLKNLESYLQKAEQHAAAEKFNVGVFRSSRLVPADLPSSTSKVASVAVHVWDAGSAKSTRRRRPHIRRQSAVSSRPFFGHSALIKRARKQLR